MILRKYYREMAGLGVKFSQTKILNPITGNVINNTSANRQSVIKQITDFRDKQYRNGRTLVYGGVLNARLSSKGRPDLTANSPRTKFSRFNHGYDWYAIHQSLKNGKNRLSKKDAEDVIEALNEDTGLEWRTDSVSNFVHHLEANEAKPGVKQDWNDGKFSQDLVLIACSKNKIWKNPEEAIEKMDEAWTESSRESMRIKKGKPDKYYEVEFLMAQEVGDFRQESRRESFFAKAKIPREKVIDTPEDRKKALFEAAEIVKKKHPNAVIISSGNVKRDSLLHTNYIEYNRQLMNGEIEPLPDYYVHVEAKDAYTSPLFKKSMKWAKNRHLPVMILSAKHGALNPKMGIKDYDLKMNQLSKEEKKDWAKKVAHEFNLPVPGEENPRVGFEKQNLLYSNESGIRRVHILGGQEYVKPLKKIFEASNIEVIEPLKGMSIGERLQYLKRDEKAFEELKMTSDDPEGWND